MSGHIQPSSHVKWHNSGSKKLPLAICPFNTRLLDPHNPLNFRSDMFKIFACVLAVERVVDAEGRSEPHIWSGASETRLLQDLSVVGTVMSRPWLGFVAIQ
jgi:hypothetical protein